MPTRKTPAPTSSASDAENKIEIGSVGLNQYGGTIHEEKLRQLAQPSQRALIYREMSDNDPVIGAVMFVVDMLLRQMEWTVEPFDAAVPADEELSKFIESCIDDIDGTFTDFVSEALSFLTFGWSWHEIVFKKRSGLQDQDYSVGEDGSFIWLPRDPMAPPSSKYKDGRIGWHKFASRAQETLLRWEFDSRGDLTGFTQLAPPTWKNVTIPLAKSLHFRTTSVKGNPEAKSILRNAYRPYYFKKVIEEIQAIGIERDLTGLPVLEVPDEIMRDRSTLPAHLVSLRNDLETMVRNIRRGTQEGVLLPQSYDPVTNQAKFKLSLLSTGGQRQFDIIKVMEYYDQRMAVMALADFVLLGHERVGSFALADAKTDVFAMAVKTWADVIAAQFNDRAIPQLLRVNGLDATRPPRLVHSEIQKVDLDKLGLYVLRLSQAGMPVFPNPSLEDRLLNEADLPGGAEETM